MDLLLTLVIEQNITDIELNNNHNLEEIFSEAKEYMLFSQKDEFNKAQIYDNNIHKEISIKKFESILYSNTILNCYREVLEDLYNVKIITKEIKEKLIKYRKKNKIFNSTKNKKLHG